MKETVKFPRKLLGELALYNEHERDAIIWHLLKYGFDLNPSDERYRQFELAIDKANAEEHNKKVTKQLLDDAEYEYIISHLNEKTGKSFKSTGSENRKWINKAISAGYSVDDCIKVIDNMVAQWAGNEKMERYLRPETLFGNKFAGYLNSNPINKFGMTESSFETDEFFEAALQKSYVNKGE